MELFDTHCHLDMEKFDVDRGEVISRAVSSGVSRMLTIASSFGTFEKTFMISNDNKGVFAAIGVSPFESEHWPRIKMVFKNLAAREEVIAIGECGLDYYWDISSPGIQKHCLESQISIAVELDKPVIIHCRDAWDDLRAIIDSCKDIYKDKLRGVIHCFTGNQGDAKFFADRGFLISFAGNITYKKSQNIRDALTEISLEDIVFETDAPFLSPQDVRGQRNEPSFVGKTVEYVAEMLGLPADELAFTANANACRLFRIDMGVEG